MYCKNCGSVMTENGCPVCGQNQNNDSAPAATPLSTPYTSTASISAPVDEDKKSIGFNILSFFIPLAGLIIFLVKKDEKPIQAKSAGKCAIAGVVVSIVLSVLAFLTVFFGIAAFGIAVGLS